MEKISRRINEIKKIDNNVKLLNEMINYFSASTSSQDDKDMMKVNLLLKKHILT